MITKGERTELRSIVKQQFKVLRSELEQRELEMDAEIEEEIVARFSADDTAWSVVQHRIHEAVMEANRQVNDALSEGGFQERGSTERMWIRSPDIRQPTEDKAQLRRLAHSRIVAQIKGAKLRLEREEADLLRTLAIGAIESEEARAFLSAIPTVGELVPASRLAELEATWTQEPEG